MNTLIIPKPEIKKKHLDGQELINPHLMTLDMMRRYPYNLWLRFIEPHIVSMGSDPEDCWCWDVRNRVHDITKWVPQVHATMNDNVPKPSFRRWNARRYIMELFYEFPETYSVYRNKNICRMYNCVRPSHLVIARHNDPEAKMGA